MPANQGSAAASSANNDTTIYEPADKVTVTMTLTFYYVPDATFLGTLPALDTYNPSNRSNPITP